MKFLNKSWASAVFMIEGRRVVAGEAILSVPATNTRSRIDDRDTACGDEGSDAQRRQEVLAALVERLAREHSRLVYRIAYAVLRRHHDAEDATQETFLRVLRYRAKLDAVDDVKPWLARIAWRVAVERARKRTEARELVLDDPAQPVTEVASADTTADEALQGARMESVLGKLVAALPANLRQPLILSTMEEMSPKQVATTLGISEAAVRSRVFRARQMLKEKLVQRTSR